MLEDNPEDYYKVALNLLESDPNHASKLQILSNLDPPPGLVHLLFLDDIALSPEILAATRIMVANRYEILQMQQDKFFISTGSRCEASMINTLWNLFKSKKEALDFYEDELKTPKSTDITENEYYRMAHIYKKGMNHI